MALINILHRGPDKPNIPEETMEQFKEMVSGDYPLELEHEFTCKDGRKIKTKSIVFQPHLTVFWPYG